MIKNGLDNYLIPPPPPNGCLTHIYHKLYIKCSPQMITYLDAIHSFILSAMGITSTLKYLDLLSYGVSSKVHFIKKRLGEIMSKVSKFEGRKV